MSPRSWDFSSLGPSSRGALRPSSAHYRRQWTSSASFLGMSHPLVYPPGPEVLHRMLPAWGFLLPEESGPTASAWLTCTHLPSAVDTRASPLRSPPRRPCVGLSPPRDVLCILSSPLDGEHLQGRQDSFLIVRLQPRAQGCQPDPHLPESPRLSLAPATSQGPLFTLFLSPLPRTWELRPPRANSPSLSPSPSCSAAPSVPGLWLGLFHLDAQASSSPVPAA